MIKTTNYDEELHRFWESLDHSGVIEETDFDDNDCAMYYSHHSPYAALGQRMGSVEYWLSDNLNLEFEVFGCCSMPSTVSGLLLANNLIFIEIADAIVGY